MNIVMVGARAFPIIKAGVAICELLGTFNKDTDTIHTRTAKSGPDAFIAEAATVMGFNVRRWTGEGGASNYIRDVDMVKQADVVYAFFDTDHVGEGGTQHVIDKSLDQHKRTLSYTWTDYGLDLIGSADPGEGEPDGHEQAAWGVSKVPGEEAAERTRKRSASPEDGPVWGSVSVGSPGQGDDETHPEG